MTDYTRLDDRNGEPIACHHVGHYAADGLPICHDGSQGRRCEGYTVQCGKGHAPCERHADRRTGAPAPAPEVAPTYTLTLSQDELTEVQLALEARHELLRNRLRVIAESPAATFGGEDAKRQSTDDVRARDHVLTRAWSRVTRQSADSPALSEMLRNGGER